MMPNQTTLRILLYKYRDFLFPVGTIVVCLLIMVVILIPEGVNIVNQENNVQVLRNDIASLQTNLSVIEKYDTSQLHLNTSRVNRAVPTSKDFGVVIDTLQRAANASNVALSDYTFQVGDLADTRPQVKSSTNASTFLVSVVLLGDAKSVAAFLRSVEHQLPLADVSDVKGTIQSAGVTLLFYYQPQTSVTVQATDNFTSLTPSEQSTLSTLATYDTIK